MSAGSELLIAILMAIGIIGTIIPFMPGLAIVWLAGAIWAYFDGGDSPHMWILAIMTLFALIGYSLQFLLPAAAVRTESAPRNTLFLGAIAGIFGFFLIPVVGAPIGFMAGVFANYFYETGNTSQAWNLTLKTAVAFGWAVILQVIFALAIALTWIVGLIIT